MLSNLKMRLRAMFRKNQMEFELNEELRFHLEKEIEKNVARGLNYDEARLAALRSFGGVEQVKEQVREQRVGKGASARAPRRATSGPGARAGSRGWSPSQS